MKKLVGMSACLGILVSPVRAAEFAQTIFFGDSLTDGGFYGAAGVPLPPGSGKFTTNPGPVWAENLAARYGGNARPNLVPGGTNFAAGGAQVDSTPGFPPRPPTNAAPPISAQISGYLQGSPNANPNSIYSVWGGANDVFTIASQVGAGALTQAQAQNQIIKSATALVTQVQRLSSAGARNIVVFTLPDIGLTPFGASQGPAGAAGLTQLSAGYNQALLAFGLASTGANVIMLDTFGMLREVQANPAAFGFVNTSVPACSTTTSLVCTSATLVAQNADQSYLYADGVHPTTAGHRLISDFVAAVIEAPESAALLAETPIKTREAHLRQINGRLDSAGSDNRFGAFASIDYNSHDIDPGKLGPGLKSKYYDLTVGADARLGAHSVVGIALGLGSANSDFNRGGGGFDEQDAAVTLYSGCRFGGGYVNTAFSYGDVRYSDLKRVVTLGTVTRTLSAKTNGKNTSFELLGGYDFQLGRFKLGPWGSFTAQKVKVSGYSESGSIAAMRFEAQDRYSSIGALGFKASLDFQAGGSTLSPYLKIAAEREFRNDQRSVRAAELSIAGAPTFSMPVFTPDRDYATADIGLNARFTRSFAANFHASTIFGRSNIDAYGIGADFVYEF